jgi:hypothetical protein
VSVGAGVVDCLADPKSVPHGSARGVEPAEDALGFWSRACATAAAAAAADGVVDL